MLAWWVFLVELVSSQKQQNSFLKYQLNQVLKFGVLCYTGLLFMVVLKWASLLVFEMEPENSGNCMVMANLYSHAGKWKQAGEVREIMKEIGLQKICGSSGIEMSGGLLGFIAKDVSKGRSDEVYALLEGLCGLMREEGYVLQEELDYEIVFS